MYIRPLFDIVRCEDRTKASSHAKYCNQAGCLTANFDFPVMDAMIFSNSGILETISLEAKVFLEVYVNTYPVLVEVRPSEPIPKATSALSLFRALWAIARIQCALSHLDIHSCRDIDGCKQPAWYWYRHFYIIHWLQLSHSLVCPVYTLHLLPLSISVAD
jgi:hypothetical protein